MARVEVLRKTVVPPSDPARVLKRDVLVLYRLDGDPNRVDTVILPEEASGDAQVQAAIKAKETAKGKGPAQTFDI